jgi:phosphatidylethanolamine-binding protein (PEBP) family uncharacterized protein
VDKPLPKAKASLTVTLPWRDGARIPRDYTCDGANRAPDVRVTGKGGTAVAIVMTDPDAPGGTFVHWTRWDGVEGQNSFGKTGYGGPCPPKGDRPHHYVVTAYELRRPLGLKSGAQPDEVIGAIAKNAVARGSSSGTYGR